ncbi:MAG: NTP transferase domain-containing protein [Anaerolineae bacterium]|nr:NTP transferase domain-containing protein [Anaerolineae bacterium]
MNAIILAGGKGTRLAPYTTVFPKPMLPIGDKPILDTIIKQLAHYGFNDVILSVGYLAELMQAYFKHSYELPEGVELNYVREEHPLGTAGSLSLIPKQSEPFLVMNGDTLTTINYRKLVEFHKSHKAKITIATHKREVYIDFGVLRTNGDDTLIGYDEKPTLHYQVSMGIYVLDPDVLELIPYNQRLDFPDLVKQLMESGEKVQCYITDEYWLDIGRHDDYAMAVETFEKMKPELLKQD